MNKLDVTCEQSCMESKQEERDMAVLRYGQACMSEKKEKYYTELINTITAFNDNNKSPLSNVKICEAILKVMIEDE